MADWKRRLARLVRRPAPPPFRHVPYRTLADVVLPDPPPRVFAVVSWGCAATQWLSVALNAHPEVFAVHSFREYLARHTRVDCVFDDDGDFLLLLAYLFQGYRLVGDVHGVQLGSLPALRARFGEHLAAAVVTRHPLPRLRSYLDMVEREGPAAYRRRGIRFSRVRAALPGDLRRLLDTRRKLFFASAVDLANRIVEEEAAARVFCMEDLTGRVEGLDRLLAHLSAGELAYEPAMVEAVYRKQLHSHRERGAAHDEPAAIFEAFEDWQREAFRRLLRPEARAIYEKLGYDLSFV